MASFARTIASMLAVDLQSDRHTSLLIWRAQIGKDDDPLTTYTDAFGLEIWFADWAKERYAKLDLTTQMVFQHLKEKYPVLAWWEIFFLSEDTAALIKAMDVDESGHFPSVTCQTSGFRCPPASCVSFPADASVTPWGYPLPIELSNYSKPIGERQARDGEEDHEPLRRSLRLNDKGKKNSSSSRSGPPKAGIEPELSIPAWPD
ncbi:hypothetical protein H0H87_012360, partial [Tephrocybe sp. NHM501043]